MSEREPVVFRPDTGAVVARARGDHGEARPNRTGLPLADPIDDRQNTEWCVVGHGTTECQVGPGMDYDTG